MNKMSDVIHSIQVNLSLNTGLSLITNPEKYLKNTICVLGFRFDKNHFRCSRIMLDIIIIYTYIYCIIHRYYVPIRIQLC